MPDIQRYRRYRLPLTPPITPTRDVPELRSMAEQRCLRAALEKPEERKQAFALERTRKPLHGFPERRQKTVVRPASLD